MSVDILPLGAPELGMSRADMMAAQAMCMENAQALIDRFYALLFAYVAGAYIAASQLTSRQWIAANLLYLLAIGYTGYFINYWIDGAYNWAENAFPSFSRDNPGDLARLWSTSIIHTSLVLVSLWFATRMRHPKTAVSAANQ